MQVASEKYLIGLIKEMRKTSKNQTEVSEKLGVGQQQLSRILRGERSISASVAEKLGFKKEVTFIKYD